MGTGKLNAGGSPAMAWHPIQRGVKYPQSLHATEIGIKLRPDEPLGSYSN